MRSTLFCLVLPGDSASARRTSEIFMSGCLPVFLGPPYGAMPLAGSIDYKAASLFFNVTDYRRAPPLPPLEGRARDCRMPGAASTALHVGGPSARPCLVPAGNTRCAAACLFQELRRPCRC